MPANPVRNAGYSPVGSHTKITPDAVYTINVPGGATGILMQTRTQAVRYTLDGSTPAAATGFELATTSLDPVYLPLREGTVLKVISATAGAVFQYQFIKEI